MAHHGADISNSQNQSLLPHHTSATGPPSLSHSVPACVAALKLIVKHQFSEGKQHRAEQHDILAGGFSPVEG